MIKNRLFKVIKAAIWIALALGSIANGADYYVATGGSNGGTGAIGDPWETITYALSVASPVGAGDTVHIRGGTYRENVRNFKSGTEGNVVTIKSYTAETAIIDGSVAAAGWVQCESDDVWLDGKNVNFANIYKLAVPTATLPTDHSLITVYEAANQLAIARWPNQTLAYDKEVSEFQALTDPDNTGLTTSLIDAALTQADNYWNDATIDIYRFHGNAVDTRSITDFVAATDTITYSPATSALEAPDHDRYSIINHPNVITVGEFAYNPTPIGSDLILYCWPTDTGNLAANMAVTGRGRGLFTLSSNSADYWTLDGVTIQRTASDGIYLTAGSNYVTIQNCTIQDIGRSESDDSTNAIEIRACTGTRVIDTIISRVGTFGMSVYTGNSNIITDGCTIGFCFGTGIYYSGVSYGQIYDCTFDENAGPHGNAIAVYDTFDHVLVARNIAKKALYAYQNGSDIVFFANIGDYEEESSPVLTDWDGITGTCIFFNNTLIGSSANNAMTMDKTGRATTIPPDVFNYCINNIADGSVNYTSATTARNTNEMTEHSNNLYTGFNQFQDFGAYGWVIETDSIDATSTALSDIFTNPGIANGSDYTLKAGSPAIAQGISVQALLASTGATTWFSDFDFTVDRGGDAWENPPSMGAYEYNGSPPTLPTIDSPTVTAVTTTTATLGATVTSATGGTITSRGTVHDTSPLPTGNAVAEGGTGVSLFTHGRTGLPAGTEIYYRGYVITENGTGYTEDDSFFTEATTQPSSFVFSNVAANSMTVSWTTGNGTGDILLIHAGTAVDSDPVDGTFYTGNPNFSSSPTEIGTNNFVMYRDTGVSVNVTGLEADTTYYFAAYNYMGDTGVNYQQDAPLTGNQITIESVPTLYFIGSP